MENNEKICWMTQQRTLVFTTKMHLINQHTNNFLIITFFFFKLFLFFFYIISILKHIYYRVHENITILYYLHYVYYYFCFKV